MTIDPAIVPGTKPRIVVGDGGNAIGNMVAARSRGHPPEEETMTPTWPAGVA